MKNKYKYNQIDLEKARMLFLLLFLFSVTNVLQSQNFTFATLDGSPIINTSGWTLAGAADIGNTNGSANTDNDELILTPALNNQSGAIFWEEPIDLNQCENWIVEFDFRIADGTGADGLAFAFLDAPPTGFVTGGAAGIPPASNGLKVIIDTYDNNCAGPNPEIQIYSGVGYTECIAGLTRVDNTNGNLSFIRNGNYHRCRIVYNAGNVTVFINNNQFLTAFAPANFVGYMGFTAGTGGSNDTHSIKDVQIFTQQAPSEAGADVSICSGATTTLGTSNNFLYRYSWSPSVGLSDTTVSNPTVTLTNNDSVPFIQTYVVATTLALNPGVCPTTDTVVVTVNPIPTASFSATNQTCDNSFSTISYTGNMPSTANFNWDFDGGNIIIGSNQGPYELEWNSIGNKTISLSVDANGCFSDTITSNVNVFESFNITESDTSCGDYIWAFNGQTYTQSGFYTDSFTTVNGCDSLYHLDLTVIPSIGAAPDQSFFNSGNDAAGGTLPGGSNDLNWTVATDSINGVYNPAFIMTPTPAVFYNSPWPDATWIAHNVNGSHTGNMDFFYRIDFTLACQDACGGFYTDPDVFCLNLDFFADNSILEIFINGVPQSANIAAIPVTNPFGHAGYTQANMLSVSFCEGWQAGINSLVIQVVSGQPFEGFLSQASINPPPISTDSISETICGNTTFEFGTQTLDSSGTFTETFQNQFGCDSLVTLALTVLPIPFDTATVDECNSYTWPLNNQTFNQSGIYIDTTQNAAGCDSIVFLDLTIRESSTAIIDTIVCDTYIAADGQVYDADGTYTAIIPNQSNCDSVITINLSIEDISADFTATPPQGISPLLVNFTNNSVNSEETIWIFGDSLSTDTVFNSSFTFLEEGDYTVTLISISENGCRDTTTGNILVEAIELIIPNTFSPNGDGINDTFKVIAKGYKLLKGEIYNRWGTKMYEWSLPNASWDGRTTSGIVAVEGTYFYVISLEDESGKTITKTGPLMLFR